MRQFKAASAADYFLKIQMNPIPVIKLKNPKELKPKINIDNACIRKLYH